MDKDDPLIFEEDFHAADRKHFRKERKIATARDRSKYKKSDQDQLKKRLLVEPKGELQRGRVLAIHSEGISVATDNLVYLCFLKGSLKQEKTHYKNLIAVGDFVYFFLQNVLEGVIVSIEERRSVLSRADNLSRRKEQLIAVNIDQVFITSSMVLPAVKPSLIDRYIIAAEKGKMEPIILINKIDLLQQEQEKKGYEEFKTVYSNLGYAFYEVSSKTGEGLDRLKKAMQGKASVFSGQSGVGKSSLINALLDTKIAVGKLTTKTFKGSHTTTTTQLIPMVEGGFCIDTPGITSFGLWDLSLNEVRFYFKDFLPFALHCKFPDCTHLKEPHCAVQAAVQTKQISSLRFASYSALMMNLEEGHIKR